MGKVVMASDVSVKENSVHILMRLKPRVKFIINEMICTISYVQLTHSVWMCAEDVSSREQKNN